MKVTEGSVPVQLECTILGFHFVDGQPTVEKLLYQIGTKAAKMKANYPLQRRVGLWNVCMASMARYVAPLVDLSKSHIAAYETAVEGMVLSRKNQLATAHVFLGVQFGGLGALHFTQLQLQATRNTVRHWLTQNNLRKILAIMWSDALGIPLNQDLHLVLEGLISILDKGGSEPYDTWQGPSFYRRPRGRSNTYCLT